MEIYIMDTKGSIYLLTPIVNCCFESGIIYNVGQEGDEKCPELGETWLAILLD